MIQQIFNFKLFKNDKIWEDDAKKSLLASKIILNLLKFWPENFNKSTKISFATITTIYVLIQFSLLVYLVTGIDDVASLTRTMSVFVLGMQIMVKMSILFFRSQDLNDILKTVRYEFWPSDISGYELQIKIKSQTDTLLYTCLLMYLGATYFLLLIALTPLINGVRELPYITWYPFNWAQSPTYEIVYVLEGCLNILNGAIVCCTDFLYYALCANCTAQFQLLCDILKQIGRGGEKELSRNLLRIPGVTYEPVFNKEYEDERKLMVLCIKHHQKILNICSKLIKIFEFGHFYQLVASVGGLGAVCFLITIDDSKNGKIYLVTYFLMHVLQLLNYCSVSNELSHWSQKLAEDAFQCLWYNRKYRDIRQCLSIMIMRSQKPISTKALGLFELSYASFVSVMRFTFSLYTFLDTFSEK